MIKNTNIMIKKLAGIIVVAAVATVTGWNINLSKNEVKLSGLALANVDALARGEWGDGHCSTCIFHTQSICWFSGLDGCMGYKLTEV